MKRWVLPPGGVALLLLAGLGCGRAPHRPIPPHPEADAGPDRPDTGPIRPPPPPPPPEDAGLHEPDAGPPGLPIDIVLVIQSLIVLFIAAPPLVRFLFRLPNPRIVKEVAA